VKALMFGGAFNPPTKAHIELGDLVRRALGYDRVIYVPTKSDYIENTQKKNFAFSNEERLSMLRDVSVMRPWMSVCDYELTASQQPRTYQTLQYLKKTYHCDELKLLMGTDKLEELDPMKGIWMFSEEICREFGIVVMERSRDDARRIIQRNAFLMKMNKCFTIVKTPDTYADISSTQVRKLFCEIQDDMAKLDDMMPRELNGLRNEIMKKVQ
jgi:nicotinate-nucleotide adenylyltransferase